MKLAILFALLLCPVLTFAQTAEQKGSPTMSQEDRAKLIKLLTDSQKETLDMLKGLSDAQWNYKAAPEKWSVGEVAEHIWLAEGLLFSAMENALKTPENPQWEEQTKGKKKSVFSPWFYDVASGKFERSPSNNSMTIGAGGFPQFHYLPSKKKFFAVGSNTVAIFDPATVGSMGRPERRYDLPGGAKRMVMRSQGIEYSIVNGAVTWEKGALTGAAAGAVLRS